MPFIVGCRFPYCFYFSTIGPISVNSSGLHFKAIPSIQICRGGAPHESKPMVK